MHLYFCNINVVKPYYINYLNDILSWLLSGLRGLAVEHACWKREVLGSNLCMVTTSLGRDFDLSGLDEGNVTVTLTSCFFLSTIFFHSLRRITGKTPIS